MGVRIGADVGGTFTDIVIELEDGSYESTKVLTTYDAPELGILDGISKLADKPACRWPTPRRSPTAPRWPPTRLIERRGAHTALVTTEGFRDVIETRTESRFEQYDLNIVLPAPLIERQHRSHDRPNASTPAAKCSCPSTKTAPAR